MTQDIDGDGNRASEDVGRAKEYISVEIGKVEKYFVAAADLGFVGR